MRHRLVLTRNLISLAPMTLIVVLASGVAYPEVSAVSVAGFVSEHEIHLNVLPHDAFEALTKRIHLWWNPVHTYSGTAANLSLDAKAGGCFCEKLEGGGSVMHMQVVYAAPGRLLRLSGGLGPLQGLGVSGSMDFALQPATDGTRLNYRYTVSGATPDGLAAAVDNVQLEQLQRLQAYLAGD